MSAVTWDERYSVNVKSIDDQHKQLIAIINDLHEAIMEKKTQEKLIDIVADMVQYTKTHFSYEEKKMAELLYPDLDKHCLEHRMFIDKAGDLYTRARNKEFILSMEVMRFLRDWLVNHIQVTDKKYSQFFNDHGLF